MNSIHYVYCFGLGFVPFVTFVAFLNLSPAGKGVFFVFLFAFVPFGAFVGLAFFAKRSASTCLNRSSCCSAWLGIGFFEAAVILRCSTFLRCVSFRSFSLSFCCFFHLISIRMSFGQYYVINHVRLFTYLSSISSGSRSFSIHFLRR